jgi:hypothetical protein
MRGGLMDSLIGSLINLPHLLLVGIVGAILGAIGGLIGYVVQRRTGSKVLQTALTGIAASLAPIVTRQFVEPGIVTAYANKDLPKRLDPVTTLRHVGYANRHFIYDYELDDSIPADFDIGVIKTMNLATVCEHWRQEFAAGNAAGLTYRYELHGRTKTFTVVPSDCDASA